MPNLLKMAKVQSILSLHAQGRSAREIARTLQVDRGTVRKYLRLGLSGSKPAIAPAGSDPSKPAAPAEASEPPNAPIAAFGSSSTFTTISCSTVRRIRFLSTGEAWG